MELHHYSNEHVTVVVTKFSNSGACDKQKPEQYLHYEHAEQHSSSSQQNPAKQYICHPSNNLLNRANKHCCALDTKYWNHSLSSCKHSSSMYSFGGN